MRIETTTHLMEVWGDVDEREPRKGAAVYAHALGDIVMLEWPGGRTLHAVAKSIPVLPHSPSKAARWFAAKLLAIGAAMFEDLHIVPMARRFGRRAQALGCDALGGVRAKPGQGRNE